MGEWKSLKIDSGTGWKEIYREAGTGWKALTWDWLLYDGFESGFTGWSGDTSSYAQSSSYAYAGSYSLKKTGSDDHANAYIYQTVTPQNISVEMRILNSDSIDARGGPTIGITAGNYLNAYLDPAHNLKIYEWTNAGDYVGEKASSAIGAISTTQWVRVKLEKDGNTYTATAWLESGTQLGTCNGTKTATIGRAGYHMYDANTYMDEWKVEEI